MKINNSTNTENTSDKYLLKKKVGAKNGKKYKKLLSIIMQLKVIKSALSIIMLNAIKSDKKCIKHYNAIMLQCTV